MTPDERSLLQRFLQDLVQTRGGGKDPEADGMINQTLRATPDAAYVLVQHAILSDQALHAAQDQIAALQNQLRAAAPAPSAGGFLPNMPPPYQPAGQAPYSQAAPPGGGFMGGGPFSGGGGLNAFIRSAAPTAAGVVGGEMLFHSLEGLFGGGRHGGGFGGGGGVTEIVNNNYYSDDNGGAYDQGDQGGDDDDDGGSDDYN